MISCGWEQRQEADLAFAMSSVLRREMCIRDRVKGTIHWVSCETAVPATIRLYENIVDEEAGVYNEDGSLNLNPNSLTVLENCYVEPSIAEAEAYDSFQSVSYTHLEKVHNRY